MRDFIDEDELPPGLGTQVLRWFPRHHSDGGAFLGRNEEFRRLTDDILAGRDRWFDCPAGYGVRTLVLRAFERLRHNYEPRVCSVELSLLQVHDEKSVADELLRGLGQLVSQVMRRSQVDRARAAQIFPDIPHHIYTDLKDLQTIGFDIHTKFAETIAVIAGRLDAMSREAGCRNIVYLNGLQQVLSLRARENCLQTLSDLVRNSCETTYLVTGTNQHAMQGIFKKDEPMHGACRRFAVRPVDSGILSQYFTEVSQLRWKCNIGRKATVMMLALPRRNFYWLNGMCRILWHRDLPPLLPNVINAWDDLVQAHRVPLWRDIEQLSTNQRAVFFELAAAPTRQPRSKRFVARTRISSASVGQAITILYGRDMIEHDIDGAWRVKNPAMQWLLARPTQMIRDIYAGNPVDY